MKTIIMATSKIYGHDEIHIPKRIIKEYENITPLTQGTLIDWIIRDGEIILKPRKKASIEDIKNIHL